MTDTSEQATEATVPTITRSTGLVTNMARRFGVDPDKLMTTLKATAFRQKEGVNISDEQMMALLVVAKEYKLNPFTKEIFAFPDKQNGIVPVVGVDGWSRIINEHPQMDGIEFRYSDNMVVDNLELAKDDEGKPRHKPCPEWCEAIIRRKDRSHPMPVREYFDEVYREPFRDRNKKYWIGGPWQSHTKRMLRHKAIIQAARIVFGFGGIYDEDEAHNIIDGAVIVDAPAPAEQKALAMQEAALGKKKSPEKSPEREPQKAEGAAQTQATKQEPEREADVPPKDPTGGFFDDVPPPDDQAA